MRLLLLSGYVTLLIGCGTQAVVPEIPLERRVNALDYSRCIENRLTVDRVCRTQTEDRMFTSCFAVYSADCLEEANNWEPK